jgi:hypothetical protein
MYSCPRYRDFIFSRDTKVVEILRHLTFEVFAFSSKVLDIGTLYSKDTRALTFEIFGAVANLGIQRRRLRHTFSKKKIS